ncbi:hypothetical protein Goarm_006036, partial [Gossypium armourianum]|nr:hypothetical protein [Gossypium armourianum]
MMKGGDEHNVPMETRGRFRKNNKSRNMLSALEGWVTNLEESMNGVKETLKNGCSQVKRVREDEVHKRGGQFSLGMKQYFHAIGIEVNASKYAEKEARAKLRWLTQQGIIREYVKDFSELMLQISDLKSFIELGLRKDKFESSKPKVTSNYGGDHKEDGKDNSGNSKN